MSNNQQVALKRHNVMASNIAAPRMRCHQAGNSGATSIFLITLSEMEAHAGWGRGGGHVRGRNVEEV